MYKLVCTPVQRHVYTYTRSCFVNTAVLFPADNHVLLYWPEENAVTPVYMADVKSPAPNELREGVVCTVKHRSNVFEGIVAAIGMQGRSSSTKGGRATAVRDKGRAHARPRDPQSRMRN